MPYVLLLPAVLQMLAMSVDELIFHRKRGLPRWERIGHPLDTLTTAFCYGWAVFTPASAPHALAVYVALAAFSCLFITKDEFVHARFCDPKEIWLHSVLFVLHPIVFLAFGLLWTFGAYSWILKAQLGLTLAFLVYQIVYWGVLWPRSSAKLRA